MATSQVVRKASRKKARGRVGIGGPAGSGKTMGALLIAYGLTGDWDKVGLIDTENGSGELYVGHQVPGSDVVIGEYNYWRIDPPYTTLKYVEGQKALEKAGCEAVIHDSLSHAWAGAGGLLDKKDRIAKANTPGMNSYTAWRDVTPDHNLLVDAMLQSPSHIIATMRTKTEYVMEKNDKGKEVPRKIGMAPIQREGMDYEFTVMLDIDASSHLAIATKDRTSIFDGMDFFKIGPETGQQLLEWLNKGIDVPHAISKEALIQKINECSNLEDVQAVEALPGVQQHLTAGAPEVQAAVRKILDAAIARFSATKQPDPSEDPPKVETPTPATTPPEGQEGWRPVAPGEVFPPGQSFKMNQTTGQSEVQDPAPDAEAQARAQKIAETEARALSAAVGIEQRIQAAMAAAKSADDAGQRVVGVILDDQCNPPVLTVITNLRRYFKSLYVTHIVKACCHPEIVDAVMQAVEEKSRPFYDDLVEACEAVAA